MATSLSVLANVPGYGGYLARRGQIEEQQAQQAQNELAQASVLQRLYQNQQQMRTAEQERMETAQLRDVMQATGGDVDKAIAALLKAGTPKSIELASKLKGLRPEAAKVVDKWSEPYQIGGAWVQKNEATGQIRQAVPRESTGTPSAPAPRLATIQDPDDTTGASTLVVDVTKPKGSPGYVIGRGPKLTQTGTSQAKLVAEKPQAKMRVESIVGNMTRLSDKLLQLEKDPGLTRITGTIMGRTPNITNTATGAQALLDSITSEFFVSTLQSMREASKTGGAVGNVSDREGDKMERVIAALGQAQGTERFKSELRRAREQLSLSMQLIRKAYEDQFGGVPDAAAQPAPSASPKQGTRLKFDANGNPIQ